MKYISLKMMYIFFIQRLFCSTHTPNPLIKIIKHYRLSYIQNKDFKLTFQTFLWKKKIILFFKVIKCCLIKKYCRENTLYHDEWYYIQSSYINIVTYIVLFTILNFTYTILYTFLKDFTKNVPILTCPAPQIQFP